MVSVCLGSVLAARRASFNQRVAEARHRRPGLDTAAFGAFVAQGVDAVCLAVDGVDPLATERAVDAAFDIGLDLVGQGLAGPAARMPWVDTAWQRLAPPTARLLAQSPVDTLGAITNAVVRLAGVPGARVDEWIERMEALTGHCETLDALRDLGVLCAWRAGMAHLRKLALERAEHLAPELAAAASGAQDVPWSGIRERLQAERWWNPATAGVEAQGRMVGGFSGLGGPFSAPPEVRCGAEGFVVRSADRHFLVIADAFGAVVLPASAEEFDHATQREAPDVSITPAGVHVHGAHIVFAAPADRIKTVANGDSVALFSPWSHQIRIVPVRP